MVLHFCACYDSWHETRSGKLVLIAVPNCQGRVSPVFDVAARLLVVDIKNGAVAKRREVVLFEKTPEGIVRNLRELRTEVLICGAISAGLHKAMQHAGIHVVSEICGEIEPVLTAYKEGCLNRPEFIMPGCCGRRWNLGSEGRPANKPHQAYGSKEKLGK